MRVKRASYCTYAFVAVLVSVVTVSCASSLEIYTNSNDNSYYYDQNGNIRDKRTIAFLLQSFADAIGYDVQKRPSVLPLTAALAAPAMAPAPTPASKNPPAVPAPAAPAPAPAAPAPAPAAPAPAVPASKAPPAAAPAPAPAAPAPAPAAPAPAPAAPAPASPAPAAPAPAGPAPKGPPAMTPAPPASSSPTTLPLLTETVQKMFNLNFNWNRNVQQSTPAPAAAPQQPAVAPPAAAAPAPPASSAPAPGPAAPAPKVPPPAPGPTPVPKSPPPAPAPTPKSPPPPPASSPPFSITPATKAPPKKYYQDIEQNDYQENEDYTDPQQIIYYPDYQESVNREQQIQKTKDYDFPKAIDAFWQNSPWRKNNIQYNIQHNAPVYQDYITPDGERGYHVRHYNKNDPTSGTNTAEIQQTPEQSNTEQYQNNQPRGFQPVYHASESQYQNDFRPGLPLSVHGIHEDKVLVAWPSPFEPAETKIKKKIAMRDRMQSSGSEIQEFKYEPETYGGFTFYTVPEPEKYEYQNYKTPSDPNIEDELSDNAKVSETKYEKKYTTVNVDRDIVHHY